MKENSEKATAFNELQTTAKVSLAFKAVFTALFSGISLTFGLFHSGENNVIFFPVATAVLIASGAGVYRWMNILNAKGKRKDIAYVMAGTIAVPALLTLVINKTPTYILSAGWFFGVLLAEVVCGSKWGLFK